VLSSVVLTLLAGIAAGCLGALLGIGGGVLLVPLLNAGLGVPFRGAAGVSLIGVLALSSALSVSTAGRQLFNPRLAIFLLLFSVSGASLGAFLLERLPAAIYPRLFGITMAFIGVAMLLRLDTRNILVETIAPAGPFDDHFYDEDTGLEVTYRVRRLPLAAAGSLAAGMLASFIGIGGGILVVPALNAWCGVPMRVAAATSVFMIGVTAVPGAIAHWDGGHLDDFQLAATAAVGVLAGFRLGQSIGARVRVRWLKLLMAVILGLVSLRYLIG